MVGLENVVQRLSEDFASLSPQLQRAARQILDAPAEVAMKTMRGFAAHADVPPSTLLRLAKTLGFEGYDSFRANFQEAVRTRRDTFRDRAELLQHVGGKDPAANIVRSMTAAALDNVEAAYRQIDPQELRRTAAMLKKARRGYVVGFGGVHGITAYFASVLRMALPQFAHVSAAGVSAIDEMVRIGDRDVVVAVSMSPYARDTLNAVEFASRQGAAVIALTDSPVSPLAQLSQVFFVVPTGSPQFFPSQAAVVSVLETLVAFVVSTGGEKTLREIEEIDRVRQREGVCATADR
jgi:DNA-binding MurR/RpiR family transcriptional regulator